MPWLLFLLATDGLVFALAPLAVTKAALFLLPLLKLLSIGFVGDVGDRVGDGDFGDLLEVEIASEVDPAFFKIGGDLVERAGVSAASKKASAIAGGKDGVSGGTSATSVVGMGSATVCGEDGVGVVS